MGKTESRGDLRRPRGPSVGGCPPFGGPSPVVDRSAPRPGLARSGAIVPATETHTHTRTHARTHTRAHTERRAEQSPIDAHTLSPITSLTREIRHTPRGTDTDGTDGDDTDTTPVPSR